MMYARAATLLARRSVRLGLVGAVVILVLLPSLTGRLFLRSIDSVSTSGEFARWGGIPGLDVPREGPVYWSSWNGSDGHQGELRSEEFDWSRSVSFNLRGYPSVSGNALYLERIATGERIHFSDADAGERWTRTSLRAPDTWRGSKISLVATDRAHGWGGWLAIGGIQTSALLPIRLPEFLGVLNVFFFTGGLIVVLVIGAHQLVGRLAPSPAFALPIAFGALAIVAYVVWGCFLVGPLAGRGAAGAALLTLLLSAARAMKSTPVSQAVLQEGLASVALVLVAALMYVSALFLFEPGGSLAELAASRFLRNLSLDNEIPQYFATILWSGSDPRQTFGDWLSSDRPPLQTGWILFVAAPFTYLGYPLSKTSQVVSIWFQLFWIPASWVWLRSIGQSPARSTLILTAIIPSFWLVFNSVYVWPKLVSVAFGLLAFALWFDERTPARRNFVLGGLAAGLAWLCHGGIAFALLGLIPVALWQVRRHGFRRWLAAACAFLALALPWKAYQSYFDPPGNRLLKWHLAGVIPVDQRGTVEALKDAYAQKSWAELIETRKINARLLASGDWRTRLSPLTSYLDLRIREATYLVFSQGLWPFGLLAAGIVAAVSKRRRHSSSSSAEVRALVWVACTVVIWVALMFAPHTTQNHQGTYLTQLLFTLASASLTLNFSRAAFGVTAVLHFTSYLLMGFQTVRKSTLAGPDPFTAAVLACSIIVLLGMAGSAWREDRHLGNEPADR